MLITVAAKALCNYFLFVLNNNANINHNRYNFEIFPSAI